MKRFASGLFGWVIQPLLVIAILAAGVWVAFNLAVEENSAPPEESAAIAPLVQVETYSTEPARVEVQGFGTIEARTRVTLVPQVSGRVVWIHPALRAGGDFSADDDLLRLEESDYVLAVRMADASLDSARATYELELADAESNVAEWTAMHQGDDPPPLVSREPQLLQARAAIASAEASLDMAKLSLERTRVRLPFAGRIISEQVDLGQYVTGGQQLATAYATDSFEVRVPIEPSELRWVRWNADPERASEVTIRDESDVLAAPLTGRVARIESELDPQSRMAIIVVDVTPQSDVLLLPGTFVAVVIASDVIDDVVTVPRSALRVDGAVWLEHEGTLRIVHPTIIRDQGEVVFVDALPAGRLVTTDLEIAVDGMAVRAVEPKP